jgi:energy-coupling factor transporter ATP-binding protein EcfA2
MPPKIGELSHVTVEYVDTGKIALTDVSLDIYQGDYIAILGRSGSGKSTLLRLLNGLIPHYLDARLKNGKVIMLGKDVRQHTVSELSRSVGLIFDDPKLQLITTSVYDEVRVGPVFLGLAREEIEMRVKYAMKVTRLTPLLERSILNLSGGEEQSTAIASVLAMSPSVLAADEPTSKLDPEGTKLTLGSLAYLNHAGTTVLLATQRFDLVAENVNRVVLMKEGRIIFDGTTGEAMNQLELIKESGMRIPEIADCIRQLGYAVPSTRNAQELFLAELVKNRLQTKAITGVAHDELPNPEACIVNVRNLTLVYPGGVCALDDLNLDISKGRMVALIGQNGSGKTSLSKCLAALLRPTNRNAKILVDGVDVTKTPVHRMLPHCGYIFQDPDFQLFSDTVFDEVAYALRNYSHPKEEITKKTEQYLRALEIEDLRDEFPPFLTKGQKRRVAVASVAVAEPSVVIVDEPTTGLDYEESLYLLDFFERLRRERGLTVLVITHEMDLVAKYAQDVVVLGRGKVLMQGTPRDVFSQPEILKKTSLAPTPISAFTRGLDLPISLSVDEFMATWKERP